MGPGANPDMPWLEGTAASQLPPSVLLLMGTQASCGQVIQSYRRSQKWGFLCEIT